MVIKTSKQIGRCVFKIRNWDKLGGPKNVITTCCKGLKENIADIWFCQKYRYDLNKQLQFKISLFLTKNMKSVELLLYSICI